MKQITIKYKYCLETTEENYFNRFLVNNKNDQFIINRMSFIQKIILCHFRVTDIIHIITNYEI